MKYLICILIALMPLATRASEQLNAAFQEAGNLYAAAENASGSEATSLYNQAAARYQKILEEKESWAVHFNLGNSLFKLGRLGEAALHYRKALALNPGNPGIRANLELTRNHAGLPQFPVSRIEQWAHHLSFNWWLLISVTSLWAAIFLLVLPPLFGRHSALTIALALLTMATTLVGVSGLYGWHLDAQRKLIIAPDAPLRAAPADNATARRRLPEALTVITERVYEDWVFIQTEQGDKGWVRAEQIGQVWE